MFRENWRESAFWLWWWRDRVPFRAKVLGGSALAVLVLVGGYLASGGLTGASASDAAGSYVLQTTVTKVVTVREHGRTVVKRIPVAVRRTIARPSTAYETVVETRLVTVGGATRVVRKVKQFVPVTRTKVVTLHGKTSTVTETQLVPTVRTQTLTNVVTNQQTVTDQATVTRPVTTVQIRTVTLPVTVTNSETHTVVSTAVQTVTVTNPITITVTSTGSS